MANAGPSLLRRAFRLVLALVLAIALQAACFLDPHADKPAPAIIAIAPNNGWSLYEARTHRGLVSISTSLFSRQMILNFDVDYDALWMRHVLSATYLDGLPGPSDFRHVPLSEYGYPNYPSLHEFPSWSAIRTTDDWLALGLLQAQAVTEIAYGFPFPMARRASWVDMNGAIKPGWQAAAKAAPKVKVDPPLEYSIIPRGLALNMMIMTPVCYASLASLATFRSLRGVLRGRRSRCPACAYDLRGCPGPACPECGTTPRHRFTSTVART